MNDCRVEGVLCEMFVENGYIYIKVKDNYTYNTIYNAINYKYGEVEVIINKLEEVVK
jgi:hypothetical protein